VRERPQSVHLAVFYTLGATALLLVATVILYGILMQHINDDRSVSYNARNYGRHIT